MRAEKSSAHGDGQSEWLASDFVFCLDTGVEKVDMRTELESVGRGQANEIGFVPNKASLLPAGATIGM